MHEPQITHQTYVSRNKVLRYLEIGEGEPFVLLPGWLSFIDKFFTQKLISEPVFDYLKNHRLIVLHMSNFHQSSFAPYPYTLDDYTEELKKFLDDMEIPRVNLGGHSAGGRFALHFTGKYPEYVKKLVLINSAGLNHKHATKRMLSHANSYFTKFEVTPNEMDILRQTFESIYNTDLTETIQSISHPTLILWGAKDKVINVKRTYQFQKLIKRSKLVVFENLGHMTIRRSKTYEEIFKFLSHQQ